MARDINAILGISEETPTEQVVNTPVSNAPVSNNRNPPLPPNVPIGELANVKNTSNSTPDQQAVASLLGNPNASRDVNSILSGGNTQGITQAPTATQKPWYETGGMPSDTTVNTPINILKNGINTALLNRADLKAPNMMNQQLDPLIGALEQETVLKQGYERAVQQEHADKLKAYQLKKAELQAQHDAHEIEHQSKVQKYHNALNEHIFAKALTPDIMYAQHLRDQYPYSLTHVPETEVNVGKSPLGGVGTANYAKEFGATDAEAQKVASMSKMQKENIPTQNKALEAINKQFPNMPLSRYENYPFILAGESGEQYLKEKMTPEHEAKLAQERMKAEEERTKQMLAEKLIEHKAKAQFEHDTSKESKEESENILKDLRKKLDALKEPETTKQTPSEIRSNIQQEQKIEKLKERINQIQGKIMPKMGGLAFDEYTNLYPAGNGAGDFNYARELMQKLANPNIKPEDKTVFIQELNKLQKFNPLVVPSIQKYYSSQRP